MSEKHCDWCGESMSDDLKDKLVSALRTVDGLFEEMGEHGLFDVLHDQGMHPDLYNNAIDAVEEALREAGASPVIEPAVTPLRKQAH